MGGDFVGPIATEDSGISEVWSRYRKVLHELLCRMYRLSERDCEPLYEEDLTNPIPPSPLDVLTEVQTACRDCASNLLIALREVASLIWPDHFRRLQLYEGRHSLADRMQVFQV